MKILQINSVCGVGSTGRIAADLHDALAAQGDACKIAYGRGEGKRIPDLDMIRIGSAKDVYAHALFSRITDRVGFYSRRATVQLIKEIEAFDPDVIHLHNLHGYYINIEHLFGFLAASGKPVVWTLHDCWAFTGHCPHFEFAGCDQWVTGCSRCVQKRAYPSSYGFDRSRKNYMDKKKLFTGVGNMVIVTPSHWLSTLVQRSFLGSCRTLVIPNGIDLKQFSPRESRFKEEHALEGKKMVLGVANVWDDRKGLGDFILLAELLPDGFQIVLVGLTQKQLERLPRKMIGIRKTENLLELAELYTAADVFVNPTYEDTFPTVNLEAMACGTPVVTYQTGGSAESIQGCGKAVKQGDIYALRESVEALCAQELSHKCVEHVRAHYGKEARFQDYVNLYKELIH